MNKTKRILALIAAVILIALYVSTLVLALIGSPAAMRLFYGAIACTIILPVLLYVYIMVYRRLKGKGYDGIQNIVFDVGNVLIRYDWRSYMHKLGFDEETIDFLGEKVCGDPLWSEFDRNVIPYAEIVETFCDRYPEKAKQIRSFCFSVEGTLLPTSYTDQWLARLKEQGYHLYILSNWAEPTYHAGREKLAFDRLMDGAIWSFTVKAIKPEPAIYEALINRYHIDPKKTVYLDDLQANLDGAKPFGFNTILFTGYEDACARLKDYGIES